MLYYKAGRSKIEKFVLSFDGVNQSLRNDFFSFSLWERTVPFTASIIIQNYEIGIVRTFFDAIENRGILFRFVNDSVDVVIGDKTGGQNRIFVRFTNIIISSYMHIHITYDGTSNVSGIKLYINNVEITTRSNQSGSISGSIAASGLIRIGTEIANTTRLIKGLLKEISIVDYVQGSTERAESINLKTQTNNSGNYLFRLPLIFPSSNFRSRNTTIPIKEIVQDIDIFYIGYPNPLVKGINLIQI